MFEPGSIAAVESELKQLVAALDPDSVPLPSAPELWSCFDRIERLASGAKTLLARRVEESAVWKREGDPSPERFLARKAGTTVGQARSSLDTSRRLTNLPATQEAVRHGQLSVPQAQSIADAAAVNPAAERELLAAARKESMAELRDRCARTKAAGENAEERHKRIHAERTCHTRTTPDGAGELLYRSTLDEVAEVFAVVQGYANAEFNKARLEGRREPHDAYAADGMLAMARTAAGSSGGDSDDGSGKRPVPVTLITRIDWDALVRGWPLEGETCEIAGVGPVPVSVVRAMVESGDIFLTAVVTRGVDVVNVAHLGRKATAHQRTALLWRDPICQAEACSRVAGLQIDHRVDWADIKITLLELLNRLCPHHHDLKTRHGWKLINGTGKRPMVPPGHPDHPDTRSPPEERTA